MRIFVTGASGHIGSALLPELLDAGHEVVGLTRSDASAAAVEAAGAEVLRGDLDDLDVLGRAAADADAVVHLAYKHDLMQVGDIVGAAEADRLAVDALTAPLIDTGKAFVGTSGTLVLAFAGLEGIGTEDDVMEGGGRIETENATIALADRGVRSSVLRLPPTVHSELDRHGFVPTLVSLARERGTAGYPGDGTSRWPAGHTLDVAHLYRLAVESAPAGTRLHAVGDEGVPFRAIAEAIGGALGIPTVSVGPEDAAAQFGYLEHFVGLDNPVSSARTRALLGWEPVHPGLLEDIAAGRYTSGPDTSGLDGTGV